MNRTSKLKLVWPSEMLKDSVSLNKSPRVILGLFPKVHMTEQQLKDVVKKLNSLDWQTLGFKQGGRFVFTQRTLQNVYLPKETISIPLTDDP